MATMRSATPIASPEPMPKYTNVALIPAISLRTSPYPSPRHLYWGALKCTIHVLANGAPWAACRTVVTTTGSVKRHNLNLAAEAVSGSQGPTATSRKHRSYRPGEGTGAGVTQQETGLY